VSTLNPLRRSVKEIIGMWLETIRGNARWFLVVSAFQMAGLAGLAQENIGQMPAGEERSIIPFE
jgi:hypothetical protein